MVLRSSRAVLDTVVKRKIHSPRGKTINAYKILVRNLKGRDNPEDLGVDGKDNIRMDI
jgi:hypothetical protein